jgi:hypothetical protein
MDPRRKQLVQAIVRPKAGVETHSQLVRIAIDDFLQLDSDDKTETLIHWSKA